MTKLQAAGANAGTSIFSAWFNEKPKPGGNGAAASSQHQQGSIDASLAVYINLQLEIRHEECPADAVPVAGGDGVETNVPEQCATAGCGFFGTFGSPPGAIPCGSRPRAPSPSRPHSFPLWWDRLRNRPPPPTHRDVLPPFHRGSRTISRPRIRSAPAAARGRPCFPGGPACICPNCRVDFLDSDQSTQPWLRPPSVFLQATRPTTTSAPSAPHSCGRARTTTMNNHLWRAA